MGGLDSAAGDVCGAGVVRPEMLDRGGRRRHLVVLADG